MAQLILEMLEINSLQLGERVDDESPAGPVGVEAVLDEFRIWVSLDVGAVDGGELPPGVFRGIRNFGEREDLVLVVGVVSFEEAVPERVDDGEGQGAGGGEDEPLNAELGSEAVGPAQEHVGDDGDGRVGVGGEPTEERVVELAQGAHHGEEGVDGEVLDVLEAGGEGGVGGEREDEGLDGIIRVVVGGEERLEKRAVFGGDENGDGEAAVGELVGEVEERDHVTLCWVWEHQDMGCMVWGGGA